MGLRNYIIHWMDQQLGPAKLEERTLRSLVRGIFGRYLQFFAMYVPMTPAMRVRLQRMRGVKIGKNVFIGSEVYIDPAFPHLVNIGNDVSVAGRNMLLVHSSPLSTLLHEQLLSTKVEPITIEDGVWVTVGAIILPGVTIGKHAVISAGVVVRQTVPPYTIVAPPPNRHVKMKPKDS
jgi:acetyltransferase-like isoleucine patch superfamily enzyme